MKQRDSKSGPGLPSREVDIKHWLLFYSEGYAHFPVTHHRGLTPAGALLPPVCALLFPCICVITTISPGAVSTSSWAGSFVSSDHWIQPRELHLLPSLTSTKTLADNYGSHSVRCVIHTCTQKQAHIHGRCSKIQKRGI